ncbi:MAG TPA: metallophosphoesterase [Acidobacteriota bacterium]|nr:metallophosphoesterase [Acidobacteriota bacterium]
MKICHFSDSHLGAGENHPRRGPSGLTLRQEDIIRSFVEVVDRIIEIKPDVCVHSGDLFHTVRPLNAVMAIAGRELHRMAHVHGIPTVIITGNHDAPRRPYVGAALEVFRYIDNLFIAAAGRLEVFDINGARFFALPHCLTTGVLNAELTRCVPETGASYNVMVLHGVAAGMPQFSMADLGEQEVPLQAMDRFDYTALGHFHNYCRVAPRAYYSGSSERLSQAERESAKGFLEVDLEPFGVNFHEVSSRQMVDIPPIDAAGKRGDQVVALITQRLAEIDSSDKIVRVNVQGVSQETVKTMPAEVIAELKERSFALDIRLEKEKDAQADLQFGRSAIGRLDRSFLNYLETVDLEGFDRDRLRRNAVKYLTPDD